MSAKSKNLWSNILNLLITIATAVLGTLGTQAMTRGGL
jgi:hypothetical protein